MRSCNFPGPWCLSLMTPRFSCGWPPASWKLTMGVPGITSVITNIISGSAPRSSKIKFRRKLNWTRKNRRKKRTPTKKNPRPNTSPTGQPRQPPLPLPHHLDETSQKVLPGWKSKWPTWKKRLVSSNHSMKSRDVELGDPATYQDYSRWNKLHREREQWDPELDRLTHKWGDLSAQLESQKSQIS